MADGDDTTSENVHPTGRETLELVKAIYAVHQHLPAVAADLLTGTITADKQRDFADLLNGVVQLLRAHADIAP